MKRMHRMPFGAEIAGDGTVRFRLWAPAAERVELCLETGTDEIHLPLAAQRDGWYELSTERATVGSRYRFRIDGDALVPDPASRFQPADVHGPSEVVDPAAYVWRDAAWKGRPWEEAVLYELHVGGFTPEGTYAAVASRFAHLLDLGVTAIELMPVADFPGRRNWGYDGVYPFAPDAGYGRPQELKALVDAAHAAGLMVFLDAVYNHFGPEGNYLHRYAPAFFTARHHTPWGAAINFDGPDSRAVRDFFIHNALYWLEEYRFDGLRLDAVHAIVDDSEPDILCELAQAVAAGPGSERRVHLVLENDRNAARYLARDPEGRPRWYAAQWNDDQHHALHVLATGESGGYYGDFADAPRKHLGRCLTEGFAYQGEASAYRHGAGRGESSRDLPPTAFVSFLQNHDQVGNRAFGERITAIADVAAARAVTAVMLLAPSPPLLFMGQEWGTSRPFPFFCDFGPDLAAAVTAGRRREFARFPEFGDEAARARIPDPNAVETFARAKLDWARLDDAPYRDWLAWHRELLALRREVIAPRLPKIRGGAAHYRLFGGAGLHAQWVLGDGARLTLMANLGSEPEIGVEIPRGKRFYPAKESDLTLDAAMPPWTAWWFLDEEAGG